MGTTSIKDTEKEWQELVEREISRYCKEVPIGDQTRFSIHKNAVQFVRANLSQVPEVRELINQLKNHEDCEPECHEHYYFDKLLKKLEGGK